MPTDTYSVPIQEPHSVPVKSSLRNWEQLGDPGGSNPEVCDLYAAEGVQEEILQLDVLLHYHEVFLIPREIPQGTRVTSSRVMSQDL